MLLLLGALTFIGRTTPLGRGKARRLLLRVADKLCDGAVRTAFHGVPTFLHLDNNTERKALFSPSYDRVEMEFLRRHLLDADAVFVDVGANSGLYTQWLAAHMQTTAKILAIEPNPKMCDRIRANVALLARKPDIIIKCCAVGAVPGTAFLDLSNGIGAASLSRSGEFEVPVEPLTTLLERAGCEKISALKIDIEGFEDRALCPFLAASPKHLWPEAIAIEHVHAENWENNVLSALVDAGYDLIKSTRSNTLLKRA